MVQGAHRTYMTDFIRDPRTGGCATGVPPANLGFRLVVESRRPVMSSTLTLVLGAPFTGHGRFAESTKNGGV